MQTGYATHAEMKDATGRTTDPEKRDSELFVPQYEDPFGAEETGEVKYRTLEWWYALHFDSI